MPPGEPALRIEGYLEYLFIENQFEAPLTRKPTNTPEADIAVRLVAHGARFEAQHQGALDNAVRGSLEHMVFAIGELVANAPRFEANACSIGLTAPSETR